ncbi:TrmH family RNA methyltransferase [Jiangella anatolica]|uniref:tRNA/rRNA methyltransferase SpoU type domain-containing protein n=1 Tax=Jiangella anatolica TaxID=2670374 RepID=A0A2W2C333_9ACTN|nr:TrmH family RNA methyltransferase [Jiangella anatolica]PZF82609.1 hypothetical protein C1I92_15835 [Jiangella anatolica]
MLAEMPPWTPDAIPLAESALVLVTDGVEIPGNLGTMLRTMDAVGADCLVLTHRKTRMSHPKVLRASQGMSITVPHLDESIDSRHADYSGRTAIVIGSEKYGVRDDFYAAGYQRIGITMLGSGDLLNAAVCASVLLCEARAGKSSRFP